MEKHYTAWIATLPDCLQTDDADVTVLRDEATGERTDRHGNTIIEWTSVGPPLFHAVTGLRHDSDIQAIADKAGELLAAEGWNILATDWDVVDSGLVIDVAPAYQKGDRVSIDSDSDNAPLLLGTVADVDDYRVFVDLDNGGHVARPFAWVTPHLDD